MTASPPPPVLLGDRLEHWVDVTPDNDAFAYGERTWTWSELRDVLSDLDRQVV